MNRPKTKVLERLQGLRDEGLSIAAISRRLGIDPKTTRRYLKLLNGAKNSLVAHTLGRAGENGGNSPVFPPRNFLAKDAQATPSIEDARFNAIDARIVERLEAGVEPGDLVREGLPLARVVLVARSLDGLRRIRERAVAPLIDLAHRLEALEREVSRLVWNAPEAAKKIDSLLAVLRASCDGCGTRLQLKLRCSHCQADFLVSP